MERFLKAVAIFVIEEAVRVVVDKLKDSIRDRRFIMRNTVRGVSVFIFNEIGRSFENNLWS